MKKMLRLFRRAISCDCCILIFHLAAFVTHAIFYVDANFEFKVQFHLFVTGRNNIFVFSVLHPAHRPESEYLFQLCP